MTVRGDAAATRRLTPARPRAPRRRPRGHRRSTGEIGRNAEFEPQPLRSAHHLVVRNQNHLLDGMAGDLEQTLVRPAAGHGRDPTRHFGQRDDLAGIEAGLHRGRAFGFHGHDADARPHSLDRLRQAGHEPAAAHGDDDGVHVPDLLDQLQPERALPGHHQRIGERMEIGRAGIPRICKRRLVGNHPFGADDANVGVPGAHLLDLGGRHGLGNIDGGGHARDAGRARHGQPMIAAGGGDDAGRRHAVGGAEQAVHRPARLEGARDLVQFELQNHVAAHGQRLAGTIGLHDGRAPYPGGDPFARGLYVCYRNHSRSSLGGAIATRASPCAARPVHPRNRRTTGNALRDMPVNCKRKSYPTAAATFETMSCRSTASSGARCRRETTRHACERSTTPSASTLR